MIHHLASLGWPTLTIAAVMAAAVIYTAIPSVIQWVRFEIELNKRVRRYEEREEAGRVSRVKW